MGIAFVIFCKRCGVIVETARCDPEHGGMSIGLVDCLADGAKGVGEAAFCRRVDEITEFVEINVIGDDYHFDEISDDFDLANRISWP